MSRVGLFLLCDSSEEEKELKKITLQLLSILDSEDQSGSQRTILHSPGVGMRESSRRAEDDTLGIALLFLAVSLLALPVPARTRLL